MGALADLIARLSAVRYSKARVLNSNDHSATEYSNSLSVALYTVAVVAAA